MQVGDLVKELQLGRVGIVLRLCNDYMIVNFAGYDVMYLNEERDLLEGIQVDEHALQP
jgi:hypothetical protein